MHRYGFSVCLRILGVCGHAHSLRWQQHDGVASSLGGAGALHELQALVHTDLDFIQIGIALVVGARYTGDIAPNVIGNGTLNVQGGVFLGAAGDNARSAQGSLSIQFLEEVVHRLEVVELIPQALAALNGTGAMLFPLVLIESNGGVRSTIEGGPHLQQLAVDGSNLSEVEGVRVVAIRGPGSIIPVGPEAMDVDDSGIGGVDAIRVG